MKRCPVCNTSMEDSQQLCPSCGTDYLSAVIDDISAGAAADTEMLLDNLEDGLSAMDHAPLPTVRETLRRMSPVLCGIALAFCLLAGLATRANIFYLLAVVPLAALIPSLVALARHRRPLGRGEVIVNAAARVFAEDAAAVKTKCADRGDAVARLDAMQRRVDEALARQRSAHLRNGRVVWAVACVVLLLAGAGVGALAVRNGAARKAKAEYAKLPEWVKLRDSYLAEYGSDEYADKSARTGVVRAMLGADAVAEAEEFFFSHCQGSVGDMDCAMLIVEYHRTHGGSDAIGAFTSKVSLRYDSDTKKIRSIKQ